MGFSPQDTARNMVQYLRSAHRLSSQLASATVLNVRTIQNTMETLSGSMGNAHNALNTLQSSFDNTTIASRIANHLEPAPADLQSSYTAARNNWFTLADDYGSVVLPDMGSSWTWDAVNRRHIEATYDLTTTTNFLTNAAALRDALVVFT